MLAADGEPLPRPRSFEAIRRDTALADDLSDAIVSFVRLEAPRSSAA
ncbi:hypothetical protein PQJ75_30420 [Rhodoplanes sp. TEM]|uniref:Uncharacterized protein n=1 Tax=Rhodoplanes tepidamans TaxID=200616 RepID=A0ABT5JJB6_RHOTP|nr:hypothetical protein [Rhodoplanes tepidamans]MDC7789622.1 hypothetical protein [Rhodoplanes tepidamans]MDC7988065.1 hypothetical protein [Rhodoplanes sp. TEM]MDQ0359187.1 hypothetical protein [Rhodoplanes tepidamans]